jgi:hypothetical protein
MRWIDRRASCAPILASEVARWEGKSCEQLVAELCEPQVYQTAVNSKLYQFEVDLLENTRDYLHVVVSVDTGKLLGSMWPLSQGFIKQKDDASAKSYD